MRILSRLHIRWAAILGAASIWLAFSTAVAPAVEPPGSDSSGESTRVVLLKNDHCLTGLVRNLGDQVVIEISPSARVSKPAKDVEFIADDFEGIYRYKLSRHKRLGPGENMGLARWCLSVGLNELAATHFLAVNKEASSNPRVKQLGVELREQLLKDEAFRSYLGLDPLPSSAAETESVQMASAGSADAETPLMPPVVATFTEHVQPILLNRCSQSGCHGLSATNKLKIIQPIGTARARISAQNCRSALQFVELDDSGMSTLVRYAMTKHGIERQPSISTEETELIKKLQSWTSFARNPVVTAVQANSDRTGSGGAMQAVYTGPSPVDQRNASQSNNGYSVGAGSFGVAGLIPVDPRAAQLRSVPRQPQFGVQPANDGLAMSELDELEDQLRRALGEPPRNAASTAAGATPPAALPANTAGVVAGRLPAPVGTAGTATAGSALAAPADPFDPAEFNRRAAAKSQR